MAGRMEQNSAIPAAPATASAAAVAPAGPPWMQRARGLLGNKRLRRFLQIAVVAVVFFYLARGCLAGVAPDSRRYPWHLEMGYVLAALLILLVRGPIICLGWRMILRFMGYSLPWATAICVYFYSGLAKYMPGSMWYAVGRVLLAEQVGVPKMITSVSIALETALVTVASITVGALALTARPDTPWWPLALVLVGLLVFLAYPRPWFALMNPRAGADWPPAGHDRRSAAGSCWCCCRRSS